VSGRTRAAPVVALRRAAAALGLFLRGFLGLDAPGARRPECSAGARRALERRAGERRSCC
jgi:hypothetical protein